MAGYDRETMEIVRRLQAARMAVVSKQPFFGVLLMNFRMALDKSTSTSYTDGVRLSFNPDFLNSLSDTELELVMMHEVLHAALGHPFRVQADYELDLYDLACDIVVNSNILYCFGGDEKKITIKQFGVLPHKTPSGKEGYKCNVEEVYNELLKSSGRTKKKKRGQGNGAGNGGKSDSNDETDVTNETDSGDADNLEEDGDSSSDSSQDEESEDESEEDEESEKTEEDEKEKKKSSSKGAGGGKQGKNKEKSKKDGKENSGGGATGSKKGRGQSSGGKGGNTQNGGGTSINVAPMSVEEIKAAILKRNQAIAEALVQKGIDPLVEQKEDIEKQDGPSQFDDHTFWEGDDEDGSQRDTWCDRIINTDKIVSSLGGTGRGLVPLGAKRLIEELKKPRLDWKTILIDFIQEDICDYSFAPPDRRMEDSPFFLPDFNEKDEKVKDILFMIDTSGSMSDDAITECYSEIYGAIQQFNGKLQGMLGFFDAVVVEPVAFEDEDEFKIIRPKGGGGTSFHVIFEYVKEKMEEKLPTSIIILTDGYAPFPNLEDTMDIPVLWIINNEEAESPPWGKVVRLPQNKKN